jgi:hypothetical protein
MSDEPTAGIYLTGSSDLLTWRVEFHCYGCNRKLLVGYVADVDVPTLVLLKQTRTGQGQGEHHMEKILLQLQPQIREWHNNFYCYLLAGSACGLKQRILIACISAKLDVHSNSGSDRLLSHESNIYSNPKHQEGSVSRSNGNSNAGLQPVRE